MYAEVIVDISHEKLDRPFTYKIPESLAETVEEGSLVEIPFGKGNKIISGYVIRIKENSDYDDSRIKDIAGLAKGGVKADSNLIRLASFIRKTYGSTQINALKTVMPVILRSTPIFERILKSYLPVSKNICPSSHRFSLLLPFTLYVTS